MSLIATKSIESLVPSKLNELLEDVKPPAKVTPASKVEAAHGTGTEGAPKARTGRTYEGFPCL